MFDPDQIETGTNPFAAITAYCQQTEPSQIIFRIDRFAYHLLPLLGGDIHRHEAHLVP